jgi:hypothetical protein
MDGTMMAQGLEYGRLGPLKQALAEAARTDESNAARTIARFVELRPGIQETLMAQRHHLLTGRRGTGKSTLLQVVRQRLRDQGAPVAVIDMERFKGRPFPDVLIEILIALLDEVRPPIRGKSLLADLRLRKKFNKSRKELEQLLTDPQALTKRLERAHDMSRAGRAGAGVTGGASSHGVGASTEIQVDVASRRSQTTTEVAEFEELKIQRLQQIASSLSVELTALVNGATQDRAVIFIDDFYYVRLADQPDVLDYLQQVCKSTGIWLKVGGVGTRMRPFRDGDPPVGMQLNQDIDPLPIDVTLNEFATAQRFLESMLDGILKPLGLATAQVFTDTARSRMVLACGGAVARDYITMTDASIDAAVERLNKRGEPTLHTLFNIQTEDVNLAARKRMNRKEQEDLSRDAGSDATRLKERWSDICDFIREQGDTAFVLIRQKDLDEAKWGEEIRQLENLRLLHRIKDAVPNTLKWRGVKCDVFMVDLGQVAVQRLRKGIPTFWEGAVQFDKLRRAEWVYGPDWVTKLREMQPTRMERATPLPGSEVQPDDNAVPMLFNDPSDLD